MNHRRGGSSRGCRFIIVMPLLILCMIGALFSEKSRNAAPKAAVTESTVPVVTAGTKEGVPAYSGSPTAIINDGMPFFRSSDLSTNSFESYGDLDSLGRCTAAFACVGADLMPTEPRGTIGPVKPTGWHLVKYAGIDGNYLYNRCHLIAYELTGENDNVRNLITGTRYMNVEGMLPYENEVADYVKSTGHHVMYRVTPVFEGDNLLASGVLMEGRSVEDSVIHFCVFTYNVQPGVTIDYATGDSRGEEYTGGGEDHSGRSEEYTGRSEEYTGRDGTAGQTAAEADSPEIPGSTVTYVVNTNTGKFHDPGCLSVSTIADHNRWDYTGSRDELIAQGFQPCKRCNP